MKRMIPLLIVGLMATTGFAEEKKAAEKAAPAKADVAAPVMPKEPAPAAGKALPKAPVAAVPAAKPAEPTVELKTSMGSIVVKLYPQKAPVSVKNFLSYVDKKYYDNTVFHRVIGTFMIQGGGFGKEGEVLTQKATEAGIINEARNGLKNSKYTLAMARRGMKDWSDASSTTSQFFINVQDNDNLNYPSGDGFGYSVFGEVIKGQKVVDRIKAVKTGERMVKVLDDTGKTSEQPMPDVPTSDVIILTAHRL